MTLRPATAAAVLAAAVLLSHFPLLSAGYVQDDHVAVEGNDLIAAGTAAAIVGSGYWDHARGGDRALYRPVTVASFALESAATGGPRPAVSHAINLALHAAVCFLLYLLAVRCGIPGGIALAAALLFAVTPAKSEAVANVVGRSELLAAGFTLAAIRLALAPPSRAAAWGAGACVLLAAGSKETGFAAIPLVALAAYGAPTVRARLGMFAPSALAAVVAVVLRTRALEAFFPAQVVPVVDNPLVAEHGVRAFATALALIARYARVIVFPFGLSNDYSGGSIPIEPTLLAPLPLIGAGLLAALLYAATRSSKALLFAAIALLPYVLVSNLLVPAGAIFAERFLYMPLAGLTLLAAWAAVPSGRRLLVPVAAVALVLGAAMFVRARDWKDDKTIFAATLRHNPKSAKAPSWLGLPDVAIENAKESAGPWHDKGLALAKSGDLAGAERAFREAIRLAPQRAEPHLNLALVLHRGGQLEAAEREVRKAILADAGNPRAFAELGHLAYETGRREEAAKAYERAVAMGRTDLLPRLRELSASRAPGGAPPR